MRGKILQAVVHLQPLGGGLRSDARDTRQIVAGLPHQRRQIWISSRGRKVPLLHGLRRHPGQIGDALTWIEHGDVVADQLERIAVAGADQHVEAGRLGLGRERADHIVGLEAFLFHVGDVEGLEHLLDQIELTFELVGSRGAVRLVLAVDLRAERMSRDVEGNAEVGRFLVSQHIDQHRGEPEHPIGVLAGLGREVLHRQREEGPIGNRVAVDQHQLGPRRQLAGRRRS